jgi:chromosome partitioning protein
MAVFGRRKFHVKHPLAEVAEASKEKTPPLQQNTAEPSAEAHDPGEETQGGLSALVTTMTGEREPAGDAPQAGAEETATDVSADEPAATTPVATSTVAPTQAATVASAEADRSAADFSVRALTGEVAAAQLTPADDGAADGGAADGGAAEVSAAAVSAADGTAISVVESAVPATSGISFEDAPFAREIADLTRRRRALAAEVLPLPKDTRVFTVANQKGGVGKTTSTVNLAAALARSGARVLVIDLDPQGNASTALGIEHRADTRSVYDVIINDDDMGTVIQKSPEFDALYCIPATIHLAGAEIELVSLVAREGRLRAALDRFLAAAETPWHYVFIDCPPSLGLLTINAFVAAREVLIPIQCEYYALEGLSQLLANIQLIEKHLNPKLTVSTILMTMFDGRTNLANQVAQDVRDHFPEQVLTTLIPRSVRISEAPSYGQTVISYDTNSPGSLSYREAAAEIARRGAPA